MSLLSLLFSQYFWKKQFDTFDNQCEVLGAALCNSCNVSQSLTHSGCMSYFSGGCMIFFAERLHDFFVERLCDFLCEEVA